MINFFNMHYSRAVQFSEVILIFVRMHLHLVTAAFATFPPAGVQQATCLTSFLIHPFLSSLRPTCLWIYSWLSYTTCLFKTHSFMGFLAFHLWGLSLVWSRLAEVIPPGSFQEAEIKTF